MEPDGHLAQRVKRSAYETLEPRVQAYAAEQARVALEAAWAELYGRAPSQAVTPAPGQTAKPAPPSQVDEAERRARVADQNDAKRHLSLELADRLRARQAEIETAVQPVPAESDPEPAEPEPENGCAPIFSSDFLHAYSLIFAVQQGAPVDRAELSAAYAVIRRFLEESGELEKADSQDDSEEEEERRDRIQRITDRHVRANNTISRASFAICTHPLLWPLPQPGRRQTVNVALVNTTKTPGVIYMTKNPRLMRSEEDRRKARKARGKERS